MTHKIRHLSFGLNIPGKTNPIDDTTVVAKEGMFLFLKIYFYYEISNLFFTLQTLANERSKNSINSYVHTSTEFPFQSP